MSSMGTQRACPLLRQFSKVRSTPEESYRYGSPDAEKKTESSVVFGGRARMSESW